MTIMKPRDVPVTIVSSMSSILLLKEWETCPYGHSTLHAKLKSTSYPGSYLRSLKCYRPPH